MAISINSSLKSSPSPSPSPSPPLASVRPTNATQVPCSWRRQCFTGMACMIIGSSVGLSDGIFAEELRAMAGEKEGKVVMRWSDRRSCPQWHANSLESIVPENLPRPSARRRFESVVVDRTAPALTKNVSTCFSL